MNPAQLQQPILDSGVRSINFFNGRVLTGSDLTREQSANREMDKRLGRAIGEGIAYGFEVSKSPDSTNPAPIITVEAGLAVNRRGQTLRLFDKIDIALVRPASGNAGAAHTFQECQPLQTGTYVAGAGVYLLTVTPAETTEGYAPAAGLENGIASCNTDTLVSGLQFRLIQLNPPLTAAELQDENHLRNVIAYKCFGVGEVQSFVTNPFGPKLTQYGLIDGLRATRLTDCDVPLGVLYWTAGAGIKFLDMWSVRRRIEANGADTDWLPLISDRRRSEGEARFLQFQEHVGSLNRTSANPRTVVAADHFQYLPAAGIIPRANGPQQGFDHRRFFQDQTYREPVFIEGARLEHLIRESTGYAPIRLGSGELIYLYEVRQNMQTIDAGGPGMPQAYLIFSSGHMPFHGEARFDVNRYDYSNYSTVYD